VSTPTSRRIEALEGAVRELRVAVAALEQARSPRDRADADLRRVLAARTAALPFGAAELLKHAAVDRTLRAALQAATIQTPAEAGAWLRDHRGTSDGIAIVRERRRRWRAVYTLDTYVSGS
jgi:hypothetical protein